MPVVSERNAMNARFDAAMAHVLKWEGGFVNHAADPGGATNHGITIGVLREWRGEPVTVQDVRELSQDEAKAIYRRNYWQAARCGELPQGLDLSTFDCAVNQGVGRAVRFLQEIAGVRVDGAFGPVTLAAVNRLDPRQAVVEFNARRMVHYGGLSTFRTFGLGWSRRLMDTMAASR